MRGRRPRRATGRCPDPAARGILWAWETSTDWPCSRCRRCSSPTDSCPCTSSSPATAAWSPTASPATGAWAWSSSRAGSEVGGGDERFDVGTVARIEAAEPRADGRWHLVVGGIGPIRVKRWLDDTPYPSAVVEDVVCAPAEDGDELRAAARRAPARQSPSLRARPGARHPCGAVLGALSGRDGVAVVRDGPRQPLRPPEAARGTRARRPAVGCSSSSCKPSVTTFGASWPAADGARHRGRSVDGEGARRHATISPGRSEPVGRPGGEGPSRASSSSRRLRSSSRRIRSWR